MVKEEAFMKLYRNLIILVVVLLALIGSILLYNFVFKSETAVDDKSISVSKFESDKASEIIIEGNEGKIVLKKNDTQWELVSGGDFPLNNTAVNSIVTNMADLTAYKLIEENSSSLDKYGLENPYKLTIKLKDGTESIVQVGNETPTKQGYYIKKIDSNDVYAVYTYIGDALIATKEDIRNKYLFDVNSADIVNFVLYRNGNKVIEADKSEEEGWQLSLPVKGDADLVKLTSAFDALVRTLAVGFKEVSPEELSEYGLDNPAYVIEAATADKNVKLLLGKKNEEKKTIYGMFDGGSEIFSVDANSLSFIDIKPIEVCDTLVFCPSIYDVSDIVVTMDGKTTTSEIHSDSAKPEDDKFIVDGIDVMNKGEGGKAGPEAFRNYYRSLVGLTYNDIEFLDQKPEGTPEITITYTLEKAPGKMVIEFVPKDDKNYYVFKNGEYTSTVIKKSVFDQADGVRKNYENLMKVIK